MRSCVLLFAAEGEEGFSFEVEEVLLIDEDAGSGVASAEGLPGGPVGDLGVVVGDVPGPRSMGPGRPTSRG